MESVTIKPDGKSHLLVTFPYSKVRVEQIKRVPGHAWNPDHKLWSVPDTPQARQALTEMFTTPASPESSVEYISVAPSKSELRPATKPRARFTPGKPLTTNPPRPLLKAVDDELVLRGMAYGTRKSYGQHLRNYLDWLKVKPQDASREDIWAYLVQKASSGQVSAGYCRYCGKHGKMPASRKSRVVKYKFADTPLQFVGH